MPGRNSAGKDKTLLCKSGSSEGSVDTTTTRDVSAVVELLGSQTNPQLPSVLTDLYSEACPGENYVEEERGKLLDLSGSHA